MGPAGPMALWGTLLLPVLWEGSVHVPLTHPGPRGAGREAVLPFAGQKMHPILAGVTREVSPAKDLLQMNNLGMALGSPIPASFQCSLWCWEG